MSIGRLKTEGDVAQLVREIVTQRGALGFHMLGGEVPMSRLSLGFARDSATFLGGAIGTTRADIPGISVEAPNAGTYLCTCDFGLYVESGKQVWGGIAVDGDAVDEDVFVKPLTDLIIGVFSRTWLLSDVAEGATITPQAEKDAGTSELMGTTSLTLWQVG